MLLNCVDPYYWYYWYYWYDWYYYVLNLFTRTAGIYLVYGEPSNRPVLLGTKNEKRKTKTTIMIR
jgi:hypothetical protein